jgi:hypothetical protein
MHTLLTIAIIAMESGGFFCRLMHCGKIPGDLRPV